MSDAPVSDAEVAKILMQEYVSARQEIVMHIQHFKTQERYASLLLALGGIIVAILLQGDTMSLPGISGSLPRTAWADLLLIFTITTVVYFVLFGALASQFAASILAERVLRIEDEINRCLRGPRLIWERLSPLVYSNRTPMLYKMPTAGGALASILLIAMFAIVLPFITLTKVLCKGADGLLIVATFFLATYLIAMPAIAVRVAIYATGQVRDDARQVFGDFVPGNNTALRRTGAGILIGIILGSLCLSAVFVWWLPTPTVCAYVQSSQVKSAITPAPRTEVLATRSRLTLKAALIAAPLRGMRPTREKRVWQANAARFPLSRASGRGS